MTKIADKKLTALALWTCARNHYEKCKEFVEELTEFTQINDGDTGDYIWEGVIEGYEFSEFWKDYEEDLKKAKEQKWSKLMEHKDDITTNNKK